MLPILRIIPVGGVLLAILILVLALSPPGSPNPELAPAVLSARGALMQLSEHPEWRQFLILAATRRADELDSLRDLPDMPTRIDRSQDAGKLAGFPIDRSDADPDDETGSISEMPSATIPIEIGEPSSTELPVTAPEDKSPVIRAPERMKASQKKGVHHARRVKAPAKLEPTAQFDFFAALFGGPQAKPKPFGSAEVSQPGLGNTPPH
jgi:hypothetical protein